ncbi:HD domain-containing protein [Schleiferilactobacillus shenzhenensis]|uniref:Exopolyphosphatase n=1 Tax=Schleiferilactobacillus shenzhenensis LY-73 TaxID=1231336 RepID=U4TLZ1_9LACO|nr:exopolyphosphatase [Schleiferilactobacillus shenzhenensis]ERL64410.1 exopolyphosphatase [Schleiferilactobacillus shenzhenensis LY-73]
MAKGTGIIGFVVIGAQAVFIRAVDRKMHVVESAQTDVDIGEDIFTNQRIQPATVNRVTEVLNQARLIFAGVGADAVYVVATHSVAEADNAEFVREQLQDRTGHDIMYLNQSQESLYRNLATDAFLPSFRDIIKTAAILVDISSGSVELTFYRERQFIFSRTLKLGPLRVFEVMRDVKRHVPNYNEVLQDYINSQIRDFTRILPVDGDYPTMILMGSALSIMESLIPAGKRSVALPVAQFTEFYSRAVHSSDQYLTAHYQLADADMAQVQPVLMLVHQMMNFFGTSELDITNLKLVDGLAVNYALRQNNAKLLIKPEEQIIRSARALSDRYQVDAAHRDQVTTFALQLFDRLRKLHSLGKRERLLLEIAATLNDIGSFVDVHEHYRHSDYLIQASEILGLSTQEQQMVGTITRFHSTDSPSIEELQESPLPNTKRMVVAKLAAILRLADALDVSRQQKITKLTVSLKKTAIQITAESREDIELEKWSFHNRADFFAEVYGMTAELKGKGQYGLGKA